jgi:hypothetical protein
MGNMNRLALFAALLIGAAFFTQNGIGELPERVAVHFDRNGAANGWISRDDYRIYILGALIGLPSLLVWLMAGLPRLTQGRGQIPNPEYWFAGERRRATESFLIGHAFWLGCMTVAIIYGLHISILRANASTPPVLATDRLITILAVYLIGLAWWFAAFLRHFRGIEKKK